MRLWQIVGLGVLVHTAYSGSRMLVALYAIHLQASPFTVGALMSSFAVVPMVIAVSAGRLVDRVGARWPMFAASLAVAVGALLPYFWTSIGTLYAAGTLIGTGFMVSHVAVNQAVGALGRSEDHVANFSWMALGYAFSASIGPLLTGFAIDSIGHAETSLLLFLFPLPLLIVFWRNRPALPLAKKRKADTGERRVLDLLRNRDLRRVLIASGLLSMGWDLYNFVVPIYGSDIGLSASTIGVIMGTFAVATFAVRLAMPLLARHVKEWHTITAALLITAGTYSVFPFFTSVPLLIGLSFVLGIGLGCSQPMVMALLYTTSPPGRQGEVVGMRTTVMNASHTVLPLGCGALGAALGMGPVFWFMAGLLAGGGYFVNRKRRHV